MTISLILIGLGIIYAHLVINCCVKFKKYKPKDINQSETKVSILVSAKNEEENIEKFIRRIQSQSHKNTELILIDDNSQDKTFQIAERCKNSNMKLLKNSGKGKKDALKFGINYCEGKYILSTDADCFPSEKWVETMISTAEQSDAEMLMAPVIIKAKDNSKLFQRLWECESFALITITSGTCIAGKPVMCNGGNIGYNSYFWKTNINNLNKKYASGDDMFMMESAEKQRKNIIYVKNKEAVTETFGVENLKQLLNQRARWVSKTGGYTESYILIFAFIIFIANVNIIISNFLILFGLIGWETYLTILLLKFLSDIFSVKVSSDYYERKQKISDIIILEIIYPYYVVASVISYLTKGFKWK
ncbi:MAG: glycosyltransferase [Bacteroidales bacterium]|nr:glycosyltransferase [Bacteroidales bacterium]